MRYALFLGCTVPVRNMNYEIASRKVAERLGIELVDNDEFSCCGFPVKGVDHHTALLMAARNLAVAEEMELDICALCTACSGTLTEANKALREDAELRAKVNEELEETTGKRYQGNVQVWHFARLLYQVLGLEKLREKVTVQLSNFKFGAQYGCHY
ncbi:MAG: CoB--CoM heterodisulfide reductase subunit B, partial [Chloroflexi bacterium]|nr:CoB--CoM heterodisulfide reductase subunit B [Chloroflexota bacterium]